MSFESFFLEVFRRAQAGQPAKSRKPAGRESWKFRRQPRIGRHAFRELLHVLRTWAARAEQAAEARKRAALTAAHALHHVGHLAVHLEEAIDVLDLGAGARSDALLAARLEHIGIAPLLRCHRIDERGLPLQ